MNSSAFSPDVIVPLVPMEQDPKATLAPVSLDRYEFSNERDSFERLREPYEYNEQDSFKRLQSVNEIRLKNLNRYQGNLPTGPVNKILKTGKLKESENEKKSADSTKAAAQEKTFHRILNYNALDDVVPQTSAKTISKQTEDELKKSADVIYQKLVPTWVKLQATEGDNPEVQTDNMQVVPRGKMLEVGKYLYNVAPDPNAAGAPSKLPGRKTESRMDPTRGKATNITLYHVLGPSGNDAFDEQTKKSGDLKLLDDAVKNSDEIESIMEISKRVMRQNDARLSLATEIFRWAQKKMTGLYPAGRNDLNFDPSGLNNPNNLVRPDDPLGDIDDDIFDQPSSPPPPGLPLLPEKYDDNKDPFDEKYEPKKLNETEKNKTLPPLNLQSVFQDIFPLSLREQLMNSRNPADVTVIFNPVFAQNQLKGKKPSEEWGELLKQIKADEELPSDLHRALADSVRTEILKSIKVTKSLGSGNPVQSKPVGRKVNNPSWAPLGRYFISVSGLEQQELRVSNAKGVRVAAIPRRKMSSVLTRAVVQLVTDGAMPDKMRARLNHDDREVLSHLEFECFRSSGKQCAARKLELSPKEQHALDRMDTLKSMRESGNDSQLVKDELIGVVKYLMGQRIVKKHAGLKLIGSLY